VRIDILTLFPEIALAPLGDSIIQRPRVKICLDHWKLVGAKDTE
jgi:tRNA G37 N-methylase TrmD